MKALNVESPERTNTKKDDSMQITPTASDGVDLKAASKSTPCPKAVVLSKKMVIHTFSAIGVTAFWRGFWVGMDHFSSMDSASEKMEAALISIAISAALPLVVAMVALCIPTKWIKWEM